MSDEEIEGVASPPIRVLIVDNEKQHAQVVAESLQRVGYDCAMAMSGPEGVKRIESDHFDIVITDLVMNEVDGMGILAQTRKSLPEAEVIVVTGHATVPRAVEAMQHGAANFLEKPLDIARLRAVTEKAAGAVRLKRRNLELNQRLDERFGFEGIVYTSSQMQGVLDRLKRIAATNATVLITGDTGSGKDLIANAIHQNSPRKGKSFVPVNCGAVAEHLVESELFGHVKGAFTDAIADRQGKFEYANGGTLFLDEVGDMPLATQIKLLRVLEDRTITRVGDNKPIKVNVRVLSATNRDLEAAIRAGTFREDLYYRLKVVTVHLPSLSERRDDIIPLADHFRKILAKQYKKTVKGFSPAVTRKLFDFDWPGSVRQLKNAVETMVVLDVDGVLDQDDLPPELADASPVEATAGGPADLIGRPFSEIERWAIEQTLKRTNGNREEASRVLKIGARTLYRKLKEYSSVE